VHVRIQFGCDVYVYTMIRKKESFNIFEDRGRGAC
jgi:hypothetical protein